MSVPCLSHTPISETSTRTTQSSKLTEPTEVKTPEQERQELRAEIRDLKAIIATNETKGEKALVDNGKGEVKPVKSLREEMDELTQELLLSAAQTKRYNDEQEARKPIARVIDNKLEYTTPNTINAPVLSREKAIALHGIAGWNRLTNLQKAQAMDVRESDLARLDPKEFFGATSNSAKSVKLMSTNPSLYRLLKQKAVDDGTF